VTQTHERTDGEVDEEVDRPEPSLGAVEQGRDHGDVGKIGLDGNHPTGPAGRLIEDC
jgi:hypothetical protein